MTEKLLQLDTPNKNGRVYPRAEIEKALTHLNADVPILGTIDFVPMSGVSTAISLEQVAFSASDIRIEGDHLVADIKVLNTPCGQDLQRILQAGISVGYRPGGTGNVGKDGIVRDFKITHIAVLPAERCA